MLILRIHIAHCSVGANLLILRSCGPYFMNIKGTGNARTANPPRILPAGPTPRLWNIGDAARGKPKPKIDLRKVLADTALAA